ncbi:MAG: sigma-70 family RNA polymerase sigma factor [Planctomycetes bacterium]|nr:sigma-70 family RNA polymerase sigma factor [Planctomycetota bacterium]
MWPNSNETQELLLNAGQGQSAAVNDLLDRHREGLRNMIRARMDQKLSRRVDASDVVQDVMLEASQRLADYIRDPKMPFGLWLRQMAQDRIIDLHRRHRVARRRSLDREQQAGPLNQDRSSLELLAQLRDPELTPAAASLRKELHERFVEGIDRLDDEDREILLMRHFEQLTNSEAAELLGVSQPAAGMRYLRALRRLREVLGEVASPGSVAES